VGDVQLLYEAAVARRLHLQIGVCALAAFLVSVILGAVEGSPYTIATTLGVGTFLILFIVVHRLTPTRIELREGEIRLIAPHATTRYEPNTMKLRADPSRASFSLGRRERTRQLAVFHDTDLDRVRRTFEGAGVSVVGAERMP
jgi:hypothetical protein